MTPRTQRLNTSPLWPGDAGGVGGVPPRGPQAGRAAVPADLGRAERRELVAAAAKAKCLMQKENDRLNAGAHTTRAPRSW
jgi:hypothetical protein